VVKRGGRGDRKVFQHAREKIVPSITILLVTTPVVSCRCFLNDFSMLYLVRSILSSAKGESYLPLAPLRSMLLSMCSHSHYTDR